MECGSSEEHSMHLRFRFLVFIIAVGSVPLLANGEGIHGYPLFPCEPIPGRTGFCTFDSDEVLTQWEPLWEKVRNTDGGDSEAALREEAATYLRKLQIGSRYRLYQAAQAANDSRQMSIIVRSLDSESFFWGQPEFLNYPGSIEHVRHAAQRYVPPYPQYNHNTLVRNFKLKEHSQIQAECLDYSEPVYWHCQWNKLIPVNKTRGPFKVYPWKPGTAVDLEIGSLTPRLMYALRIIGATRTEEAEKQFVFKLEINDGPGGEISTYILRGRACDNFYETVVFMFHCVDTRVFKAKITLLKESQATLYTYNIDVHDVFGECAKHAGKMQSTLKEDRPTPQMIVDTETRANRDEALWQSLPPLNVHLDDRNAEKFSGGYSTIRHSPDWDQPYALYKGDLKNPEAVYTREDMIAHTELPDSGGDRGWGIVDGEAYRSNIALCHQRRYMGIGNRLSTLVKQYQEGDIEAGRDGAFLLCALAYQYPAVKSNNSLIYASTGKPYEPTRRYGPGSDIPGGWGKWTPVDLADYYDGLFDYIKGNNELVAAVGRFIPWIKTPADLQWLLDVYTIQYAANQMSHFRFYYDHGLAQMVINLAEIQGDNEISKPWMEFIWTRGWELPQTLAGLADNIITNCTRDGVSNIGSYFYATPVGWEAARLTEAYIKNGGLRKYDLSDFRQYPKNMTGRDFRKFANPVGGHNLGIGDVGGPSTRFARIGQVNKDLHLKSRVLSDWATILETGSQYDDTRFRRAAAITMATGAGHAHHDTLDLRVFAHGCIMSGDFNQRPAYGRPRHQATYVHNLLEVDGNGEYYASNPGEWDGYIWVRNLFDAPGSPYALVESTPPFNHQNVKLMQRHVAVLDVDEGSSAQGDTDPNDPNVLTPSSYFLDVIRVAGGKRHTYCFHGCSDDGFEVNVKNKTFLTEDGNSEEEKYMQRFRYERYYRETVSTADQSGGTPQQEYLPDRDRQWAADIDGDLLTATWRLDRYCEKRMVNAQGAVTEPYKYTRLHLFDQKGARILHGIAVDTHDAAASCLTRRKTSGRCLYAQKNFSRDTESVYVALIEPYAGAPFITERELLAIPDNETDALRAAAVRVKTTFQTDDICFTDGRPDKKRSLPGGIKVAGEFAYLSSDKDGLRQATLTGGTLLEGQGITIKPVVREYRGRITKVDFLERTVQVEGLPAIKELQDLYFEIGNDKHLTAFQIDRINTIDNKTELHCKRGLEIMRARVLEADYANGRVRTNISMLHYRGRNEGLIATGDNLSKRWRVTLEGGNRHEGFWFKLHGAPITTKDFPLTGRFSVWEFGVGDVVSLRTGISLKRTDEERWKVYTTASFHLGMNNNKLEWSPDNNNWKDVTGLLGPAAGTPVSFWIRVKQ